MAVAGEGIVRNIEVIATILCAMDDKNICRLCSHVSLLLLLILLINTNWANAGLAAKAFLVESIPADMDLPLLGNEYTADALIELLKRAQKNVDVTAMYWNLLAESSEKFSEKQLNGFGANRGKELYSEFLNACMRGVQLRFLISKSSLPTQEVYKLQKECGDRTDIREFDAVKWYGAGIMHEKIWIVDRRDIYLGSANMDWLSLSQVKELGIVFHDAERVAKDAQRQFDAWWQFSGIKIAESETFFSDQYQTHQSVPCWSEFLPRAQRCKNPEFKQRAFATRYNWAQPMCVELNGKLGELFISNAPSETSGKDRTWDLDGIIKTIQEAKTSVDISVMDFLPTSLYVKSHTIWWPAISNALLSVAMTKGVRVRILISKWAHTREQIFPYLKTMQDAAKANKAKIEIRIFEIPGWQSTDGPDANYPPYSRVNHAKYMVTDHRANIGTSNWTWDYFYQTSGASMNLTHEDIRGTLSKIFERDWHSKYVSNLDP